MRSAIHLVVAAAVLATSDVASAACGDGIWSPGEHCGQDAFQTTGSPEMNHDCVIDFLDSALFIQVFGSTDPQGDFDANGLVHGPDFLELVDALGDSVSPCTPVFQLGGCSGTLALSFSSDPTNIVQNVAGLDHNDEASLYVVADGWSDAASLEYSIVTSPDLEVISHLDQNGSSSGPFVCQPDPQSSARVHALPPPSSNWDPPVIVARVDVRDSGEISNASYVKLVPSPPPASYMVGTTVVETCGYAGSRLRWGTSSSDQSFDFAAIRNASIGESEPVPPGISTCQAAPVPTLRPSLIGSLAAAMLAAGTAILWTARVPRRKG